ncbi:hypothetical protein SynMVIR181_02093 [Synechococcus sp. MVIR-18-1]|nr:hypothetical protein SynMVIR181_02093 [Synechococcus sp. MVIR-18-1]
MENLEAFRQALENRHRKNDASQAINLVAINLTKAKSELSHATTSLAELMDIADEQNCKSCLVFLAELRATAISAYNTINSAEKELQNRGGCQSSGT